MKLLFPLPIVYDGTETRYLQRDGARFAQYLVSQGHEAVKIIIDDGSGYPPPKSPLLEAATWAQWTSPAYWKGTEADLVLLYGGTSRKLLPVAQAVKQAEIPLFLKMDSSIGLAPRWHTDFWRLLRTTYHVHRQTSGVAFSIVQTTLSRAAAVLGYGRARLPGYLRLFDIITVENEYASRNMQAWFRLRGMPELAEKVQLLPHPIPDHFAFDPAVDSKSKVIIAVAQNWSNPLKGGRLLAKALAKTLSAQPDYTTLVVGGHGDSVVADIGRIAPGVAGRARSHPPVESDRMKKLYGNSRILAIASGSESGPLVAYEAACCGCSIVFPPELKHLGDFETSGAGRMAGWRSAGSLAHALLDECAAWDTGQRDPIAMSEHWSKRTHTSACTSQLYAWVESYCRE